MKQENEIFRKPDFFPGWCKYSLIFFMMLFICFLGNGFYEKKAMAAGATVNISTKNTTVVKGDTVYVVIRVSSSEAIKSFEGYFTYDSRILQFITGGNVTSGNDDAFKIDDTNRSSSSTEITYSVKFKARKAGSSTISLRKPYQIYSDEDTSSKMSVSYNSLNILVRKKAMTIPEKTTPPSVDDINRTEEKPSAIPDSPAEPVNPSGEPEPVKPVLSAAPTTNPKDVAGSARLRKLSVAGAVFAPDFSPKIKKYSAIVTTDEKKLDISYETKDSHAKVVIKGNKSLKQGKNVIKIIVQGTAGKKTTYRLSVTIQRTDGSEQVNRVTMLEKGGKLYLQGSSVIEVMEADESLIPAGFIAEETAVDGKKITAYILENNREADFVLLYGKGEEPGFFLYDMEEGGIYPYEKVKAWYRSMNGESAKEISAEEQKIKSLKYVIGIMASFCGLLFVILTALLIRTRKR